MAKDFGFERYWQDRLSNCLEEKAGDRIRDQVMAGGERLTAGSNSQEVIAWTRSAIERLDSLVDDETAKEIMASCACQYPKSELQEARRRYEATKDIDLAHRLLQERFESFLRNSLGLDDDLAQDILRRGWGLAGIRQGSTIVATKIPKSGHLVDYMNESDPEVRRQHYCHCPRVREALRTSETLPVTYCYCGAGFYKGIWEEILQAPVGVEVLETVLGSGDVCRIAIRLPQR
jgi:hypothetical protein